MDTYIWLALMVVFLIVEAACPLHLVSIWFAVGSLAGVIVSLLGGALWLQILLFVVVSGGLLALLWPFVKKIVKPNLIKTNVESLIGLQGYVTADIDNLNARGQLKLNGMEWSARSTDGRAIPAGTLVQVDKIEGVRAFVSAVEVKV